MIVFALDRRAAGHLFVALRQHRQRIERGESEYPPRLVDLEHLAQEIGRTGTAGDSDGASVAARPYARGNELLTQRQAASKLGVHPRTVRRMLDRGELAAVKMGSTRRISRREVEDFGARKHGGADG